MKHTSPGSGCASRGGHLIILGVLRGEGDPISAPAASYLMEGGPARSAPRRKEEEGSMPLRHTLDRTRTRMRDSTTPSRNAQ